MKHDQTAKTIHAALTKQLQPAYLEVINNSAAHKHHTEAKKNPDQGHFSIHISAECLPTGHLNQHRAINSIIKQFQAKIHDCEINIVDGKESD